MDNVTHTLFALTLARTPLGRGGRSAAVALVIASNVPDVDIVATFGGAANYLAWHRGPTHGPLGVVGLGAVTAGIVWMSAPRSAPFARLLGVSIIGVLLHVLMDLPTSYGTRLLSPFSWRWFAMDVMPIIDVYLWIILAAGLAVGSLRPRIRHTSAVAALVLMTANYGVRIAAHQNALATAATVYGPMLPPPCDASAAFGSLVDSWPPPASPNIKPAGPSRCLVDTAAIPAFASPFAWRVVARLPDEYVQIEGDRTVRISNRWTPQIEAAANARSARILLGFSRFPVARAFPQLSGGATVEFSDMRFEGPAVRPLQRGRSSLFTVTVDLGAHAEILRDRLGE